MLESYESYMNRVDMFLIKWCGMDHMSLPDCMTRDMYDEGLSHESCAYEILTAACEGMGFDPDELIGEAV